MFAVLIGSACSSSSPSPDNATSTAPARKTIGAAGGTVSSSDNAVTLTVPPGATSGDVEITISRIAVPVAGAAGQAFEIGPTGTQFNQPVTLVFRYADADLGGSAPSAFAASTVVNGAWQPITASIVDPAAHTIAGTTMHLSPYGIAKLAPPATVDTKPAVADAGADSGADSGTPAVQQDAGTSSCEQLNQGKPITDAKAAVATFSAKFNQAATCTSACKEHKTPTGTCVGISTGASTTELDAADADLLQKLGALTPAESECYAIVAVGCGYAFVCTAGSCQFAQ